MTNVNETNESPKTDTNTGVETTGVKLEQEQACKRGSCADWSKQATWKHGKRRWKVLVAAFLIGLFGFILGKASYAHHQAQQMQAYNYDSAGQRLPLSMILDGIAATPEQRAKAVELVR